MFLTKTEIDQLTYAECQQQLKMITTEYNLDKPIVQCFERVWPVLDELTNMILMLEDRIAKYEDLRIFSMDKSAV